MRLIRKHTAEKNTFHCPMKCEGEKTYDSPGNCPVCNMRLVEINK